jgi:hypothetical protein
MPVTRRVPSSPAITLLLAVCWLAFGPRTPDLAAQMHRVAVFAADGFAVWDNSWYGGHPLLGYSLTFPALGALFGARLVGAMAAVRRGAVHPRPLGERDAGSALRAGARLGAPA